MPRTTAAALALPRLLRTLGAGLALAAATLQAPAALAQGAPKGGGRSAVKPKPAAEPAARGSVAGAQTAGAARFWILPPGPAVLTRDSFPHRIFLRNVTSGTLHLLLGFYDAAPGGPEALVAVRPETLTVAPLATAPVELTLRDGVSLPVPYAGYLGVRGDSMPPETLGVRILAGPEVAATSPRLVEAWTLVVRRFSISLFRCDRRKGLTCASSTVLPLQPGATPPASGTVLGYVADSVRGVAAVRSGDTMRTPTGALGVVLNVDDLRRVGRYKGDIALSAADTAKVRLNVLVTHDVALPGLVILLGVVLGFVLQKYGEHRAQQLLQADILEIDEERGVEKEFRDALAGVATSYSVRAAAADARARFQGRADEIAERSDGSARAKLQADVDAARDELAEWPHLGFQVAALSRGREALRRVHPPAPDEPMPAEAAFLANVDRACKGAPLEELAGIARARAAVARAATQVERWLPLNFAAQEDENFARALEQAPDFGKLDGADQREIKVAHRKVLTTWVALWREDFDPEATQRALDEAEATLHGWGDLLQGNAPAPVARPTPKHLGAPPMVGGALAARAAPRATPAAAPARHALSGEDAVRRRLRGFEEMIGVVVLTVAVLLGLKELYYTGAPFGTIEDYIGAFLWGFGAKAGWDALRALGIVVLNRLGPATR